MSKYEHTSTTALCMNAIDASLRVNRDPRDGYEKYSVQQLANAQEMFEELERREESGQLSEEERLAVRIIMGSLKNHVEHLQSIYEEAMKLVERGVVLHGPRLYPAPGMEREEFSRSIARIYPPEDTTGL